MKKVIIKLNTSSKKDQNSTGLKKQAGFSFIEVIVAALILSTSILGIASLQIVGMKGTQQSTMKSQAMGVIHNLTERMRANNTGVVAGNYELSDSAKFDCASAAPNCTVNCNAEKIATTDLHNLVCGYGTSSRVGGVRLVSTGDKSILLNGTLNVTCLLGDCSDGDVVITVGWAETAYGEETVAADSMKVTTRIAIP